MYILDRQFQYFKIKLALLYYKITIIEIFYLIKSWLSPRLILSHTNIAIYNNNCLASTTVLV